MDSSSRDKTKQNKQRYQQQSYEFNCQKLIFTNGFIYYKYNNLQKLYIDFKMDPFQTFLHKLKTRTIQEIQEMIMLEPSLVNHSDQFFKKTPIFTVTSCYQDNQAIQLLILLIDAGANIRHQDINKRTIAFTLCSKGMINCLKMLISKDQQILTHRDRLGQTPLFAAVRQNQFDLLKQIDPTKELINMVDDIAGHTILFYAAACGYERMCKYLVKKGADLLIIDECGQNILSYTSKMPKFHKKATRLIQKLQYDPKENEQSISMEQGDKIVGKQAYQLHLIQDDKIMKVSNQQQNKLIEQWQEKQRLNFPNQQSYFNRNKLDIDEYDEYLQNWRHNALKIINSCLRMRAGKWFLNVTKAPQLLPQKALKKTKDLQLIDFSIIITKLEHNVYENAEQFAEDMAKVWQNCQKKNSPDTLIYKYAQQLRNHVYKLMVQYNFLNRY